MITAVVLLTVFSIVFFSRIVCITQDSAVLQAFQKEGWTKLAENQRKDFNEENISVAHVSGMTFYKQGHL